MQSYGNPWNNPFETGVWPREKKRQHPHEVDAMMRRDRTLKAAHELGAYAHQLQAKDKDEYLMEGHKPRSATPLSLVQPTHAHRAGVLRQSQHGHADRRAQGLLKLPQLHVGRPHLRSVGLSTPQAVSRPPQLLEKKSVGLAKPPRRHAHRVGGPFGLGKEAEPTGKPNLKSVGLHRSGSVQPRHKHLMSQGLAEGEHLFSSQRRLLQMMGIE